MKTETERKMFRLPTNAVIEIKELSIYVRGFGNGSEDDRLLDAADWLEKLSNRVCGQGYIGCTGGIDCGSDHK